MVSFIPGSRALVKGSFEEVEVVASSTPYVLVKRASGQTTFTVDQLVPYEPDVCPIN